MSDQLSSDETFTVEVVLTDDDIKHLEKASIIEPVPPESKHSGTCTVTVSRLHMKPKYLRPAPSTTEKDDIDGARPYQVNVPLAKESIAVFDFLGFTPVAGRELCADFIRQKATPHPLGLEDYVYERISLLQTSVFQEMTIDKAIVLVGLERSFIQNFSNPRYAIALKSNHSLYAWVKHAIRDRYRRIRGFQIELQKRALWLQA